MNDSSNSLMTNEEVGVENTAENRRIYRQMLFEAKTPSYPGLSRKASDFLSGAILDPETLMQTSTKNGGSGSEFFPQVLMKSGIIPGVKPHLKVYALPGTGGDTVMQGLDSLAARLSTYYQQGARFTKWRAPLEVDIAEGKPTRFAIEANMKDLARYIY